MKSFIETAALITGCGSAAFWFASAMCRLRGINPGKDELARIIHDGVDFGEVSGD